MQGPFVGLVIDPKMTIASGKVKIGVFRTYPKDKNDPEHDENNPDMAKVERFGNWWHR
jgi:hypothetical protein